MWGFAKSFETFGGCNIFADPFSDLSLFHFDLFFIFINMHDSSSEFQDIL